MIDLLPIYEHAVRCDEADIVEITRDIHALKDKLRERRKRVRMLRSAARKLGLKLNRDTFPPLHTNAL